MGRNLVLALCLCALSGCALRTATRVSIGCSMVAHGADVATSMYGSGKGVVSELNPILAPSFDNPIAFGVTKMGIATAANYALLKLEPNHPQWALALGLGQCVGISAIAAHNAHVIRKATP